LVLTALAVMLPLGLSDWRDARAADTAEDVLEQRLRTAKLEYKKVKDGVYRVLVEAKGEITSIVLEVKKAGWKDSSDKEVLYVWVWTEVMRFPADFKPPSALLARLVELNDRCRFGNIGFSKSDEGNPTVYRNVSFFLKGVEAEQVADHVYMMHFERVGLKKQLKGFAE
jgi:hypothetical protein